MKIEKLKTKKFVESPLTPPLNLLLNLDWSHKAALNEGENMTIGEKKDFDRNLELILKDVSKFLKEERKLNVVRPQSTTARLYSVTPEVKFNMITSPAIDISSSMPALESVEPVVAEKSVILANATLTSSPTPSLQENVAHPDADDDWIFVPETAPVSSDWINIVPPPLSFSLSKEDDQAAVVPACSPRSLKS